MMMWRELANRIRIRRVAGEQVGLAAASAEISGLLRTAATRLLHPCFAAEVIEARRVEPDPLDACISYAGKFEVRQHARGVTRKGGAVRRNTEEDRTQAVHARLRPALEVVGHDEIDLHAVAGSLPKAPRRLLGALQLFAAGEQLLAIQPRPAVVLGVRELDVLGLHLLRHLEDLC